MSSVIVFETSAGVSVLNPADCGLSIVEIGVKDVPAGIPFWIVERDELPDTPQFAWEIDAKSMGKPAGHGTATQEVQGD